MNLTRASLDNRAVSYFAAFILLVGGTLAYFQLGQLEDPVFTVKTASITVNYPGASPEQVELEVIDLLETKLQEMSEVKHLYSMARPGKALIKVDIKNEYWSDRLPQVWDTLRKKIADVESKLPPGAGKPVINDDFGYVFGFLLAVTADGYSYGELEDFVKDLRKEMSIVKDVARVDFWGVQKRRVYLDMAETQLTQLGISTADITATLRQQGMVVDSGSVELQSQHFRIVTTGEYQSASEIGELAIVHADGKRSRSNDELIRIKDIATVREAYIDPPVELMRVDGLPAIALAMAPAEGVNLVEVGARIDRRLEELEQSTPVGLEWHRISWQSDQVAESISAFMISLAQAVVIVLALLAVTMGIRVAMIIGLSGLVMAITGSFLVMSIVGIDLQRVSLGALIIAMGMMVDNAIVVVDGFVVRLKQGMAREAAAIEAATLPSMPLLGATIVAVMAFYPIFASTYDTGEYAGSLFQVVGISLLISWLLSQTITPLMCVALLPDPEVKEGEDPYDTKFFNGYRGLLGWLIRGRVMFLLLMVGSLLVSLWGFGLVDRLYFPDSSRTELMVDYWDVEGTRIETVSEDLKALENELESYQEVNLVSTFIGRGPPRFYLPVNPESAYSSYAQLVVNIDVFENVDIVKQRLQDWLGQQAIGPMVRVRKYAVGAFDDWKFEARFSGPANADLDVLRQLAEQGKDILRDSPYANQDEIRTNWRQRSRDLVVHYNQERARWSGISREDVGNAAKRSFDGIDVGLYREGDELIPIVVRATEEERARVSQDIYNVQIVTSNGGEAVPLGQVVDKVEMGWVDNIVWRWDRRRAITVQAATAEGVGAPTLMADVMARFEALELPPGYNLEWDGEFDSARQSTEALIPGFAPTIVIILFIIVMLFNSYRAPIIILLVIPFIFIGITTGMLIFQPGFGFIALLGAMSLSGMMIKNSVVLLDQVNIYLAEGQTPYQATINAGVSRLNPVMNAAGTTVLGMIPLLGDVFWVAMAVTIMFGLAFGTVLTMLLVPVLYTFFYRIKPE